VVSARRPRDREDDEPDEEGEDGRDLEAGPEHRGREAVRDGEHLDGHRPVPLAPPQHRRDTEEDDEAVDEEDLAEQSRPGNEREGAGAEEGGRGIRPRGAQGDGALEGDQRAEEAEHHEDPVHPGQVGRAEGRPDLEEEQAGVQAGEEGDAGREQQPRPPVHVRRPG
jgi:hypothetical protein